jgi:hypothetical protein
VAPSVSASANWQALVAIAAGILAALLMLTPRRKRRLE